VPRILVADDNSNLHRMVALALKDAGVEVVAVGNGEAAVRKIAEIKPDLVLADIFMPVRSGYEVCEFVKHDPRFSSTPVVLLIGAFDPFDEREAQRVQADGILKKPFVPPDALLRTVTDLLAQSATRMAPVPVAAGVAKADGLGIAGTAASALETESAGYMDAAPEEFEPAKARLEWNANDQPLAFSTLLETPSAETEDSVLIGRRDSTLGEPAFWTPRAQPEGPQDEVETEGAQEEGREELGDQEQWRSSPGLDVFPGEARGIPAIESAVPQQDSALEPPEPAAPLSHFGGLSSAIVDDTAPLLPELPTLELPLELPEPAAPLSHFGGPSSAIVDDTAPLLLELPTLELSPAPAEDLAPPPPLDSLPAIPTFSAPALEEQPEPAKEAVPDLKDFAWATPSYPPVETVRESEPKTEDEVIEPASPGLATLAPLMPAPVTEPAEKFGFDPLPAFRADSQLPSAVPESAAHPVSHPDPAVLEAIVQRVIDRMQPKIIDLVTRELLRPVVEALVQRELEKK